MSALVWFSISSFHIFNDFVTPLRLTYSIHASSSTSQYPLVVAC